MRLSELSLNNLCDRLTVTLLKYYYRLLLVSQLMSGEQQPLLLVQDSEAGTSGRDSDMTISWRERTAEFLESAPLHKTIIGFVRIKNPLSDRSRYI